jgi:sugar phosphate isomerase/epimerase
MAERWPIITADWNFWPDGLQGEQIFAAIRRLGFSGIEIGVYESAVELSSERQAQIADWQVKYRLTVPAVLYSLPPKRWPTGCLTSPDRGVRRRVIDESVTIGRTAHAFGTTLLGVWLGGDRLAVVKDHPTAWRRLVEGVHAICDAVREIEMTVAIEYKPGEVVGNADAFLRLTDAVRADNLGMLLDTGHSLYGREDPAVVLRMVGPGLVHIHLDDNYGDYDRDLPPGVIHNFESFFSGLLASEYRGPLSFDLYWGVAEEGISGTDACRQGKEYVEKVLAHLATRRT